MIDIPKKIILQVMNGESQEILEKYLLNNYPIPVLIKAFAELIITAESSVNRPQILVTEQEMEYINSLFRVKGMRTTEMGEVVRETRGRPRKKGMTSPFDETEGKLDL